MRRSLITGVNGFCGRHLVKRLLTEGVEFIFGADITPEPGNAIGLTAYYQVDITNDAQVSHLLRATRPDSIFHLAGTHQGNIQTIYAVNVLGSIHLLENVRLFSPHSRLLMVGSAAEYGNVPIRAMPITETQSCQPFGPYGMSKYGATQAGLDYARACGLNVTVVRPFNVVGAGIPATLVTGALLERIKRTLETGELNPEVSIGNLDTHRDFIAIDDVIDAYMSIFRSDCWGEIFNICSGKPRSIHSVLETLLSFSEKAIRLKVAPELIRSSDVHTSYGSFEKARRAFGFTPRKELDAALKDAWDYAMGADK